MAGLTTPEVGYLGWFFFWCMACLLSWRIYGKKAVSSIVKSARNLEYHRRNSVVAQYDSIIFAVFCFAWLLYVSFEKL